MPDVAPQPTPERKPAWRAAALAYRETRRAGLGAQAAADAATRALIEVWPLPWAQADAEAVNAVAYASSFHTRWFWDGVSGQG